MRRKIRRRKVWINGHFVDNPKTEGYRKFLEATLPIVKPDVKGIDQEALKDWLKSVQTYPHDPCAVTLQRIKDAN